MTAAEEWRRPARLLTIAGSDSSGGAGLQADLKTFAAFGAYGMSAVTAVTAQNTRGVLAVQEVKPEVVAAQIRAVFDDIGVDAVKIGMLAGPELVETVADTLGEYPPLPVVLDPVMVASSGDRLLSEAGVEALAERLLPRVTLVTPNLEETALLLARPVKSENERYTAARELGTIAGAALVKGGHDEGDELLDLLYDGERFHRFTHPRLATTSTHGTGCTLSAAIAAGLAAGRPLAEAVERAEAYLERALRNAPGLGGGKGPLGHFEGLPTAWGS